GGSMTYSRKNQWIIKTAATAVLLVYPLAFAQQRVGEEGRALDANNRVGNVTGGREFRGNVPYTDPREFRGNVDSADFDRFISGSAGAPRAYAAPQNFLQQIQQIGRASCRERVCLVV